MDFNNIKYFSDLSEFNLRFNWLDRKYISHIEKINYCEAKFRLYRSSFPFSTKANIEWTIRIRKSLKENITAFSFFHESSIAKRRGCKSSFFFLTYYCIFHSMLAVLYLNPELSIDKLDKISHKKLKNEFIDNYVSIKDSLFPSNFGQQFETLKFYREYYSYAMPLNNPFDEHELDLLTGSMVKRTMHICAQLSSFDTLIIEKVFKENAVGKTNFKQITDVEEIYYFIELFKKVNGKKNLKEQVILDAADKTLFNEILSGYDGFFPCHYVVELEHFTDEFGGYHDEFFEPFFNGSEESEFHIFDIMGHFGNVVGW